LELGQQQKEALEQIIAFFHAPNKRAFSLEGYAGTGKSFLVSYIIEYLESKYINYVLAAPTHKAKVVLERFTKREGMTLHKLLSLSPNIEILNLDFNYLEFLIKGKKDSQFPIKGVVICDEGSMINDDLFDLLLKRAKANKTKILFVSDKAQLKPVNGKEYSKIYQLKDNYTLTKIFRQDKESGLNEVLPILRTSPINVFKTVIGKEGSIYCENNIKDLFIKAIPSFKKAIKNQDILESKLLAYTNTRVEAFNIKTKELLFSDNKQYNKFEMLTCYDNITFEDENFWNSMDYIIVDEPIRIRVNIPNFISLPGYSLNLYDSSSKSIKNISILDKDISSDYLDSLAVFIEETRLKAISLKKINRRQSAIYWNKYFRILESFTLPYNLYYDGRLIRKKSFSSGYSTTVHKSQGSTYNNVFIDMKDLGICKDYQEWRQLQYVAISRTKINTYIYQ